MNNGGEIMQVDTKKQNNKAIDQNSIQGKYYRITMLTNALIRLEYSENGLFEDRSSQTVINRNFGNVSFDVIEDEQSLEILTDKIHLHYLKNEPFSSKSLYIDVRFNYSAFNNRWYYGQEINTLKGALRTLDGADGEIPLEDGIISKEGFAVLDDSNSFLIDENSHPIKREFEQDDVYFFGYGREYLKAVQDFFELSGYTPLLPKYALGNWWSRFWRYNEEEYKSLIDTFKEEKVPLSVSVIDMDWHLTDVPSRFGSGWTGYTWNEKLFPSPKRFLTWLHEQGLAVTLNVHPADGVRAFEEQYPVMAEKLGLNTELEEPAQFNLMSEDFRESYFEDLHHPLEEEGVDFWWIDWQQGEESSTGIDPMWLLNHYHYIDVQRKEANDIILSRYVGPGSHRYPIGFSGDTIISWDSLKFQPYLTSTSSNIGYTWWSHDIGGHYLGKRDEELTLRWTQFGVFSPINRLHSSNSAFSSKEPWQQQDEVRKSMAQFLRLRHALIPYLYSMNVQTHEKGIPLIQPMYYHYPDNDQSYDAKNQYFFGSELVVAPITKKCNLETLSADENVYFPEGNWFDIFTNNRYKGETVLRVYRQQSEMPVFAKEGAILPLDADPVRTKGEELPETIEWLLYPGKSNKFELVEDKDNKRVVTTLCIDQDKKNVSIYVDGEEQILPENRTHKIYFNASEEVSIVHHQNCQINGKMFDTELNRTSFSVFPEENKMIVLEFNQFEIITRQDLKDDLFKRLYLAQVSYEVKDHLWNLIENGTENLQLISLLNELDEKELSKSLFELIYLQMS